MTKSKALLLCLGLGFLSVSCEVDKQVEEMDLALSQSANVQGEAPLLDQDLKDLLAVKPTKDFPLLGENLRGIMMGDAVAPSECGTTEFVAVQNKYIMPLLRDPYALQMFTTYSTLSLYGAYFDRSKQYFGEKGEYTQLVVKRQRELESFWGMPNEIRVNGQHNATLNNRDKLAELYQTLNGYPRELAYQVADLLLQYNLASPNLPESPFFSIDGFATSDKLIVIGDGLVQMISETGVSSDIVYTGILAHEWAHQVQFKNMAAWYPNGADEDPATATRYTELEADFFASYYMTHKRGATYNWKRVEQFFNLFFQIGDCGFASDGHHGTPAQRMAAAQLGYELAQEAQKKGHILSQEEVHAVFTARIGQVL